MFSGKQMLGTDLVPPRNLRNNRARGIGFRDDRALLFLAPATPAANAGPDFNPATRPRSIKYIVNHICEPIPPDRPTSADLPKSPQGAVKRPLTIKRQLVLEHHFSAEIPEIRVLYPPIAQDLVREIVHVFEDE